jgi:predicted secreted protein
MKRLLSVFLACTLLCGAALAESKNTTSYDIILGELTSADDLWTYTVSDETVLAVTDNGQTTAEEGVYGEENTHSFSITGLAAGDASVTFACSSAVAGGDTWAHFTYSFTVNQDLTLTLTDTQGYPEENMADWIILWQYEDQAANMVWTYELSVDDVLQLEEDEYYAYADSETTEEDKAYYTGGLHEWAFHAIGEGDVTVTFFYISTVKDSLPEARVSYDFTVGPDMLILPVAIRGDSEYVPETMSYILDMLTEQ